MNKFTRISGKNDYRNNFPKSIALTVMLAAVCLQVLSKPDENNSGNRGKPGGSGSGAFVMREITTNLASPFEISYGPDNHLWISERTGKRLLRVNPQTGEQFIALDLGEQVYQQAGQDGLLGFDLVSVSGTSYVYLAFTYDADPDAVTVNRKARIQRYTWNGTQLTNAVDVITGLPASTDHNAGRLKAGPDNTLYYSIGDQGAGQFANSCMPNLAQALPVAAELANSDWSKYAGKVLRLNTDGTIPSDNPVLNGVRSHIFTYGHRNPQGLVFSPAGTLFSSEHGPKTDDEVNQLQKGQNYGWPHVVGYQDNLAYSYANWSGAVDCASLGFSDYVVPASVPVETELSWTSPFISPMATFYTVDSDYNFMNPDCTGAYYICWPSIAPGSVDYYSASKGGISGWKDSLIVSSLKHGALYKMEYDKRRNRLGSPEKILQTTNRYRDLAIDPSGRTIYVITDSSGRTLGDQGTPTSTLFNKGSILAFTWEP